MHYVCVRRNDLTCLGVLSGRNGESDTYKVSYIIKGGKVRDPDSAPPASHFGPQFTTFALKLHRKHAECLVPSLFALFVFMLVLICRRRFCSFQKTTWGLQEPLMWN